MAISDCGKVYSELQPIRILAGDTLPAIRLKVSTSRSMSGATAQLLLAHPEDLSDAVVSVDCTPVSGGFVAALTSAQTVNLYGMYDMHIKITFQDGLIYRRVHGSLFVQSVPRGASDE